MFGHQDNQQDTQQHDEPQHDGVLEHQDGLHPHDEGHVNPALPGDVSSFGAPGDDTPQDDAPVHDDPQSAPGDASDDSDLVTPAVSGGQPLHSHDDLLAASPTNDLLDIKLQALKQLTPLVDHLDQSPEEKFRTTMMMIQASDDQELVKAAYEAAQAITDEKAKAQALLDIVNEINYFTHQNGETN